MMNKRSLTEFERFLNSVEQGKIGLNEGIPTTLNWLDTNTANIQRGRYDMIAAETSAGKTALADFMYLHAPYSFYKANQAVGNQINLKIGYMTWEIAIEKKIAKMVALNYYRSTNKIISINNILSKGKNRISEEVYTYVINSLNYYEELRSVVDWIQKPQIPAIVEMAIREYLKTLGQFFNEGQAKERFEYFNTSVPNYVIIVLDHAGKVKVPQGMTKKEAIDALSSICIEVRNVAQVTIAWINQFNRTLGGLQRTMGELVLPSLDDIKDSGEPAMDADNVYTLMNLHKHKVNSVGKYDFNREDLYPLRPFVRLLSILKNRDGRADLHELVHFLGAVGSYKELPLDPNEIENIQSLIRNDG